MEFELLQETDEMGWVVIAQFMHKEDGELLKEVLTDSYPGLAFELREIEGK